MAYDGSGTFNRLYNWQDDAANGINIMADRMDAEFNGIANGMSLAFLRDGQAAMQSDADFGNFRLLRVAAPELDTDGVNKKWIDDNFLSSTGSTTISGGAPSIIFEETDQISDLSQWRIRVNGSTFSIEPLQSDGSAGTDFGGLDITRNVDGTVNFNFEGGNLIVDKDERDSGAYLQLASQREYITGIKFRRQTPLEDGAWEDILIGRPYGSTSLAGVVDDESDILKLGNTTLTTVEYVAHSQGRHDFFCGTTYADMVVDTDGVFALGNVVATSKLYIATEWDASTLELTHGVAIGHGGTNSYFANHLSGNIEFRFGGEAGGDTKSYISDDGVYHGGIDTDNITLEDLTVTDKITAGMVEIQNATSTATGFRVRSGTTGDQILNMHFAELDETSSTGLDFLMNLANVGGGTNFFIDGDNGECGSYIAGLVAEAANGGGVAIEHNNTDALITNRGGGKFRFRNSLGDDKIILDAGGDGHVNASVHVEGGGVRMYHGGSNAVINNLSTGSIKLAQAGDDVAAWDQNGAMTCMGIYDNGSSLGDNEVRITTEGLLQRKTSLGQFKEIMRSLADDPDVGEIVDAIEPIVYKSLFPMDKGEILSGFTVENIAKEYPVAVNGDNPVDYDMRSLFSLLWAEVQHLRKRTLVLEGISPK